MIRLLALDVDGTLTDGCIHISESGEIFKSFNVKDGYGIKALIESGVMVAIITGRKSKIVEVRAKELGIINIYQGVSDKLTQLKEIAANNNLELAEVAYMGDDLNDYECIVASGLSFAPNDAIEIIKETADIITINNAGHGAVRDCCDHIINYNKETCQ